MTKKTDKKLVLSKQTVRALNDAELVRAAGGGLGTPNTVVQSDRQSCWANCG